MSDEKLNFAELLQVDDTDFMSGIDDLLDTLPEIANTYVYIDLDGTERELPMGSPMPPVDSFNPFDIDYHRNSVNASVDRRHDRITKLLASYKHIDLSARQYEFPKDDDFEYVWDRDPKPVRTRVHPNADYNTTSLSGYDNTEYTQRINAHIAKHYGLYIDAMSQAFNTVCEIGLDNSDPTDDYVIIISQGIKDASFDLSWAWEYVSLALSVLFAGGDMGMAYLKVREVIDGKDLPATESINDFVAYWDRAHLRSALAQSVCNVALSILIPMSEKDKEVREDNKTKAQRLAEELGINYVPGISLPTWEDAKKQWQASKS